MKSTIALLAASCALSAGLRADIPPAKEPPDVPAIRLDKEGKPMQVFFDRHEEFLKRGKQGPIGVLFIRDSITAGWASAPEIWQKNFGGYQPANFGIGGDRTQNVLWRIENGELDGITPRVVVVLIGVNNGVDPRVAGGVRKVVGAIRGKLPDTRVLLLGIFPYGKTLAQYPWTPKTREHVAAVNRELAAMDDGDHVRFLDFGAKFLQPDGSISDEVMPDGLHPAKPGYQIWADAMKPLLDEMMKAP